MTAFATSYTSHADVDSATARLLDVQEADPSILAMADVTAWEIVLDRIELDVMRGERNLARGLEFRTDPWDIPDADLGPLPVALADRAAGIHRRQHDLIQKMNETLHYTWRQQAVAEAASRDQTATPYPVYVDVVI